MKGAVRERDAWVWAGLAIIGISAAILSFSALADLAYRCGMTGELTAFGWTMRERWLFPFSIDAFAVTATVIWLRRRVSDEAVDYARRAAWAAIIATVGGNAYHGYVVDAGDPIPWLAVVVVSAAPAVALGALVHLAVLVGRSGSPDAGDEPLADPWAGLLDDVLAEPWAAAIHAWAGPVEDAARGSARPAPSRDEPNEVLARDLRAEDAARRADDLPPLSRDGVVERYGVGKTRAAKIRELAEQLDAPPAGRTAGEGPADEPLDEPAPAGLRVLSSSTRQAGGRHPGGEATA